MKCAICNEETFGQEPVRWGPEEAHRRCVIAFRRGQDVGRAHCAEICHTRYMELEHGTDRTDPADDFEAMLKSSVAEELRDAILAL